MTLTPEMATKWLAQEDINRKLKFKHLGRVMRKIEQEGWMETGDSIKFDWNGHLVDGQHRLLAIKNTGKGGKAVVVTGLNPNIFTELDSNKTRSSGDALHIKGYQYENNLASAARHMIAWEQGVFNGTVSGGRFETAPSNADILRTVKKHPGLYESVVSTSSRRNLARLLTPSLAGFFHYLFSGIDAETAMVFFDELDKGENLKVNNPAFVLREKIRDTFNSRVKMSQHERAALIIKAWNMYLNGTPATGHNLKFRAYGPRADPFPEVVGLKEKK